MSDLISRQAAIDAAKHAWAKGLEPSQYIELLPLVQPKHGKWIPVTNGRGGHECDQCRNYAPSYASGREWLSDFCPNCGADMRGKQDE